MPRPLVALAPLLTGCATAAVHPDFDALAADHGHIAVVPPFVKLDHRTPRDPAEALELDEQEERMAAHLHGVLVEALRDGPRKRPLTVTVQNPGTTWARMEEAGLDAHSAATLAPDELADLLGVDAVVTGRVQGEQLLRPGGAVVVEVVSAMGGSDGYAPTWEVTVALTLTDAETATRLWTCEGGSRAETEGGPRAEAAFWMECCADEAPYR